MDILLKPNQLNELDEFILYKLKNIRITTI